MMLKSIATATDPEIMEDLGRHLPQLRKARGLTLEGVAERTGTVGRAERGDNPTLLTLIRILRAYGRLGALDSFLPEAEVSPMALIEREKRRRG
jgi:putative transcriptional regulator